MAMPIYLSRLLCLSVALIPARVSNAQDRVFPTKGGPAASGKIIERTKDKVVIESTKGTQQNFATNEVARIVFEGEPTTLSRAKDYIVQGQYEQASDELGRVVDNALKSKDMQDDYGFYRAYLAGSQALRGQGDPAAATKSMIDWAKNYSNSHNFYAASEMLGNLAIAQGQPDQAIRFYSAFAAAPFSEYKLKGNFLHGRSLLLLGKTEEAKAKFSSVVQVKVSDTESLKLQKLATVASVKCDAADGKADQAVKTLESMVDEGDSTDSELFSELYNTLGAIYQSQNNHYEAVLSYLKTDLLYSTQPEAHAEALYNLSKLWGKVGEPLQATDAKARLSKLYPTSPWINK